jgi:hypothetical protein
MIILSPHLSYCRIGGVAIFLDMLEDRYFAIASAGDASDDDLMRYEPVRRLMARDACRAQAGRERTIEIPRQIIRGDRIGPRGDRMIALDAARCLSLAFCDVWIRSLHQVCAQARLRQATLTDPADPSTELGRLAACFERTQRYFPVAGRCLPQAFGLQRFLAGHHLPTTLVFGVSWEPFAAHCWVQTDTLLLSGPPEEIRSFTPIAAIP